MHCLCWRANIHNAIHGNHYTGYSSGPQLLFPLGQKVYLYNLLRHERSHSCWPSMYTTRHIVPFQIQKRTRAQPNLQNWLHEHTYLQTNFLGSGMLPATLMSQACCASSHSANRPLKPPSSSSPSFSLSVSVTMSGSSIAGYKPWPEPCGGAAGAELAVSSAAQRAARLSRCAVLGDPVSIPADVTAPAAGKTASCPQDAMSRCVDPSRCLQQ